MVFDALGLGLFCVPGATKALQFGLGPVQAILLGAITGVGGGMLRDLVHEDVRQVPILARDIREAGIRRIRITLRHAVADDIYGKLPAIRVPTMLLRGSRDPIAPGSWLDRMAARLAGVSVVTVDGAAHNVVTTAGAETAAAVRRFVRSRAPAA
jgi:pimeloyl-ACP methyl ester carboxylesterase